MKTKNIIIAVAALAIGVAVNADEAVVPVSLVCVSGLAAGSVSRLCMDASWIRVVVTSIVAVSVMVPLCLFRVLDSGERGLLAARLRSALGMVAIRRT